MLPNYNHFTRMPEVALHCTALPHRDGSGLQKGPTDCHRGAGLWQGPSTHVVLHAEGPHTDDQEERGLELGLDRILDGLSANLPLA